MRGSRPASPFLLVNSVVGITRGMVICHCILASRFWVHAVHSLGLGGSTVNFMYTLSSSLTHCACVMGLTFLTSEASVGRRGGSSSPCDRNPLCGSDMAGGVLGGAVGAPATDPDFGTICKPELFALEVADPDIPKAGKLDEGEPGVPGERACCPSWRSPGGELGDVVPEVPRTGTGCVTWCVLGGDVKAVELDIPGTGPGGGGGCGPTFPGLANGLNS